MNKITYDYDPDYNDIEIYVDGKEIVCWSCDGTPKESVEDFTKIFNLGAESQAKRIEQLEAAIRIHETYTMRFRYPCKYDIVLWSVLKDDVKREEAFCNLVQRSEDLGLYDLD